MKLPFLLSLLVGLVSSAGAASLPTQGLILDLDAEQGITVDSMGRVVAWTNQVRRAGADVFVPQDEGREIPGSGRPRLKPGTPAGGGHRTIEFHRQELVNFEEDTFDALTTGQGYTWISVMCVYPQVSGLKDVNSFFGNLRNGGNYEGFWAGLTDDNRIWCGTRNGITFGRWDENNPFIEGPALETHRFYVVAGRMSAGTSEAVVELFVDEPTPVASSPIRVNTEGDPSRMAIGQERDATNHPGHESFDGEIARFLIYDRPLSDEELEQTLKLLADDYGPAP